MKSSGGSYKKQQQKLQKRGSCKAFCCNCRLSVSSSEEAITAESSANSSDRYASISSLAHAIVQQRLDQMIRERQYQDLHQPTRHHNYNYNKGKRMVKNEGFISKFVVMVAMEKSSYDPREDFKESMIEMIMANRLEEPKDLRSLLNYYLSMNSQEFHGIILEVFHEVCSNLFLYCKCH